MQYQLMLSIPDDHKNKPESSPDKVEQYLDYARTLGWDVGTYKEFVHG